MSNYLLIESRDPFESRDTRFLAETALMLAHRGHQVTLFLIQNGVLAARCQAHESSLQQLLTAGITILADDFSLCERGIGAEEMRTGIQSAPIETLVEALIEQDTKAIWH